MKKPTIELKNVKYAAFASEETPCYEASLYVDGKRWATVRNDGHGGCDHVAPVSGDYGSVFDLDKRIRATYPKKVYEWAPEGVEETLEGLCHELVDDYLARKDLKRALKKLVARHTDGQIYSYKAAPSAALIDQLKAQTVVVDVLNALPFEEALAIWKHPAFPVEAVTVTEAGTVNGHQVWEVKGKQVSCPKCGVDVSKDENRTIHMTANNATVYCGKCNAVLQV